MSDSMTGLDEFGLQDPDVGVLLLAPMVAVAWADGKCDRKEIEAIVDKYDVQSETSVLRLTASARRFLHDRLLSRKPDHEMLSSLIDLLSLYLDGQPLNAADRIRKTVAEMCIDVAEASGGFGGLFNRIGPTEREMIRMIVRELDLRRAPEAREMLRAADL